MILLQQLLVLSQVVLVLYVSITQARPADEMNSNLAKLNNTAGETPCNLEQEVSSHCSTSQRRVHLEDSHARRDGVTSPTTTECTCNDTFFNLWSACLLVNGNNSLPIFKSWLQLCQGNSVDVDGSYAWIHNQYMSNNNIPPWAWAPVPNNGTFVVESALQITAGTEKSQSWTLMMILTPIMVGTGVFALAVILFLLYRRKKAGKLRLRSFPHPRHLLSRMRSVHTADRGSTWTIDQPEVDSESFVFVDLPSPAESAFDHSGHHMKASVSLPLLEQDHDPYSTAQSSWHPPSRGTWRDLNIGDHLRSIPVPWKKQPIRVHTVAPTRRFRLNDFDQSTDASSSRRDSNMTSSNKTATDAHGSATAFSRNHGTIYEDEEEGNNDGGVYPKRPGHDDEHTSLISPLERSENSIFLISRTPGVDFSIESGSSKAHSQTRSSTVNTDIQIVSPSPTISSPPSSAMHHPKPSRPLQPSPLSRLPPVPTHPAPQPPSNPQRYGPHPPDGLQRYDPQAQPLVPLRYSPRPSDISRQYSPQPPNIPQRYSPQPHSIMSGSQASSSQSSLVRPPVTHTITHARSRSDNSQFFPSFERKLSGDSLQSSSLTHQSSFGDFALLSTPPVRGGRLPDPEEEASSLRRRGHSPRPSGGRAQPDGSRHHLDDPRRTPHPTGTGNGVYYSHARSLSSESVIPPRGDPVMLFPGSVRAAGYGNRAADVSSESVYPNAPPGVAHPNDRYS